MVSFLSLIRYIPFDYVRGSTIANRANIVAVSPKFTAPQPLFYLGKLLKQLPARDTFYNIHDLWGWIPGRSGEENVDVVAIRTKRYYFKTVFLGNFPNYFTHTIADFHIRQDIMTIFYNPNKMILDYIPRMCGYGVIWHMPRLYHNSLTRVGGYPPTTPLKCSPPQGDGVND